MRFRSTGFMLFQHVSVILAGLAGLIFCLISPAFAAACRPPAELTPQQQELLSDVPAEMLSILRSLQQQDGSLCQSPRAQWAPPVDVNGPGASDRPPSTDTGTARPNEIIVLVRGQQSQIAEIAADNSLDVISIRRSELLDSFVVRLTIPDGRSVAAVLAQVTADARVETAAPQNLYRLEADKIEQERFAPKKLYLHKMAADIDGRNIKIAVIDTAVDTSHPAIKNAVTASFDAVPGRPATNSQHGTAIAGLIAGRKQFRGVAPAAELIIARAFDKADAAKPTATTTAIIESLDWAMAKGAQVVNMSFAGPYNKILSQATSAASERGTILIAAAGNNGPKADAAYPAADPWVLAITAVDTKDRLYRKANIGPYVFVSAPGVDILAPAPKNNFDLVSGTSFAAAFVAGVAALLLQASPNLSPRQIAQRLEDTAQDLGKPGRDPNFGAGLINAAEAVALKK